MIIVDGPDGSSIPARIARGMTPALFGGTGQAQRRFWEFFTAHIRNPNTRRAYLIAVWRFADWCGHHGIPLAKVEPMVVAAYVEELTGKLAPASVKQHLAAIRMLFDWLVVGQVLPFNPASSVRGPKHVVKEGKTPVLRGGGEGAPGRDRSLDARRLARPGADRRPGVQLCADNRGGVDAGCGLLHARKAILLPAPRKGRAVQRGAGAPFGAGIRGRVSRGGRAGGGSKGAAFPELSVWTAGPATGPCDDAGDGAARGDLCAQLPRNRDHGVSPEQRRSGGRGSDRGPRVNTNGAFLQPGTGRDLVGRDRTDPHLNYLQDSEIRGAEFGLWRSMAWQIGNRRKKVRL